MKLELLIVRLLLMCPFAQMLKKGAKIIRRLLICRLQSF